MFKWLLRGVVFIVSASLVSATNQEPTIGFVITMLIFVLFYGVLGLLNSMLRCVRVRMNGSAKI